MVNGFITEMMFLKNCNTEALHPKKLKRTSEDIYAHARNIHVELYDHILKIFDVEAIIITLLILDFLYFIIYIFVQKNKIYQMI